MNIKKGLSVFQPWKGSENVIFAKNTWPEIKKRVDDGLDTVLVPLGATEQHGPILPVDNDIFNSVQLCLKAALKSGKALVAPPLCYGVSQHHMEFPGTIWVDPNLFTKILKQITLSLRHHGIKNVLFVTGHGGNMTAMKNAVWMLRQEYPDLLCAAIHPYVFSADYIDEVRESEPGGLTGDRVNHTCETEVSVAFHLRPEEVRKENLVKEISPLAKGKYTKKDPQILGVAIYFGFKTCEVSATGVTGDPTKATAEKGERITEYIVDGLVDLIDSLPKIRSQIRKGDPEIPT
ncbi:MAG: creatininase family protein [Candidatus Bathyarchaeota archaeon]|nr:creatininase family protein [Candidatus Bathyarchaeota archaeon]